MKGEAWHLAICCRIECYVDIPASPKAVGPIPVCCCRLRQLGLTPRVKSEADSRRYPNVAFCAPPSGSDDYAGEVSCQLPHRPHRSPGAWLHAAWSTPKEAASRTPAFRPRGAGGECPPAVGSLRYLPVHLQHRRVSRGLEQHLHRAVPHHAAGNQCSSGSVSRQQRLTSTALSPSQPEACLRSACM